MAALDRWLPPVVLDVYLVGSGKGDAIVVLCKLAGDVHPQQGQLLIVLILY